VRGAWERARAPRSAGTAALALALGAALSACSLTFDATRLGVPVTMATEGSAPPPGERFEVTGRAVYALWGLVRINQPSLRRALAAQLIDGQSVAELRIRVRSRFSDLLVTGLTLGLVVPRAITYEGVIVGASTR
jgi:hypothetical protein